MPKWIHGRAEHLLAKNPSMDKSQAFAIATQQSHKMGKSPKGYGTKQGKIEARAKFDKPRKVYERKANPGGLDSPKLTKRANAYSFMADELEHIEKAAFLRALGHLIKGSPVSTSTLAGQMGKSTRSAGSAAAAGVRKQMAGGRFKAPAIDHVRAAQLERMKGMKPSGLDI